MAAALGPSPSLSGFAPPEIKWGATASATLGPGHAWCPAHTPSCPEHSWAQRRNSLFSEFAKAIFLGPHFRIHLALFQDHIIFCAMISLNSPPSGRPSRCWFCLCGISG